MNWSFNRKPRSSPGSLSDGLAVPAYAGANTPLAEKPDFAPRASEHHQQAGLNNTITTQASSLLAQAENTKELTVQEKDTSLQLREKQAPVVAVLGAKGGTGATTLALNLATAMAQTGSRTTLIDADLQKPDICHIIGKDPRHSLTELLVRSTKLDEQLFEACQVSVTDSDLGLSLLSPALDGTVIPQANLTQLAHCLTEMRSFSDFWIVDLPRHLDRHFVTLGDICDKIVLVFEATVSGIAASHRWLNIFAELGYDTNKIICVLNRGGSKFGAIERELGNCFGDRPIVHIPNASGQIWHSANRGLPTVLGYGNHAYTRAVNNLAKEIKQELVR